MNSSVLTSASALAIQKDLREIIREVPDFPKPGILFKDITPLLQNPDLCKRIIHLLCEWHQPAKPDIIAGVESRGFLFGFPMAMEMGIPFALIRKAGKLPAKKISASYELEYGSAIVELHEDNIYPGMKVAIHDDLLATGGTSEAAARLVKMSNAEVCAFSFLLGLDFLNGESLLQSHSENVLILARF